MSTITREKLRERAREKVKSLEFAITQTAFADSRAELEEELELARIALASLEAEAVHQVYDESGGWFDVDSSDAAGEVEDGNPIRVLYTAPPALVVPVLKVDWQENEFSAGWNACRSAMLQGAEPVTTACKLPELRYLDSVKFNADCALQDPESIYAQEFFMSLDEVFGERGNYTEPVQAKAVSILIAEIFRLRGYPSAPRQEVKP